MCSRQAALESRETEGAGKKLSQTWGHHSQGRLWGRMKLKGLGGDFGVQTRMVLCLIYKLKSLYKFLAGFIFFLKSLRAGTARAMVPAEVSHGFIALLRFS